MKTTTKHIAAFTTGLIMLSSFSVSTAQDTLPAPDTPLQTAPAAEILNSEKLVINEADKKALRLASWNGQKVAIRGKDVVSFHNNDKPLKGKRKYAAEWDNTTWRFASEENRDLFLENPEKYVPGFGGFCPVALADNNAKIGHINHYSLVDDELFFNYNAASKSQFSNDTDNILLRAQLNF